MQDAAAVVAELGRLYEASRERLRTALQAFIADGTRPDASAREAGAFAYPELRLTYGGERAARPAAHAWGRLTAPGTYATSITRPALFRDYLIEQINLLVRAYGVTFEAVPGRQEIPFPYVLDAGGVELGEVTAEALARWFPATELAHIGDEVADGLWNPTLSPARPLALFDALRTDFSLARLRHYTGTPPEHVQRYVLFTNYHRYVDEFVRWACEQLTPGGRYVALSGAGGVVMTAGDADPERMASDAAWRRHQMPAWHLMSEDGTGISLVNIGVGPSNAKTATDHIAVLRPHAWLMVGHCAGLRNSQSLGDFVLAHAYLREDHVLDDDLPAWVPIPALAEVQVALQEAVAEVTRLEGYELKRIMRTGTVATIDNRNWELRDQSGPVQRLSQSRAIALDMESATIAANGFRFRVPYGTLLCVSDKPLHGELKLPGMATDFYRTQVANHLQIGIRAMEKLRETPLERIHSRKLRSFNETAFL